MIIVKNKQRKIFLETQKIKNSAQQILHFLNYEDFDLGILFTTPAHIQEYNHEYRTSNKPTDILSFSPHPSLKPGSRLVVIDEEEKNLGDLILCPQYIVENLEQWNMSFEERLEVLLVHGVCHLLGYDHELDEDYEIMKKEEERILRSLREDNS